MPLSSAMTLTAIATTLFFVSLAVFIGAVWRWFDARRQRALVSDAYRRHARSMRPAPRNNNDDEDDEETGAKRNGSAATIKPIGLAAHADAAQKDSYVVRLHRPSGVSRSSLQARAHLKQFLADNDIDVTHEYTDVMHGFAATMAPDVVTRLQAHAEVAAIQYDVMYKANVRHHLDSHAAVPPRGLVPPSAADLSAAGRSVGDVAASTSSPVDVAWGLTRIAPSFGVLRSRRVSSDIDVYVLDTGIKLGTAHLNVVGVQNFTKEKSDDDLNGHGTHVAGTVGARDTGTMAVGVAPNCRLYAVKVLDGEGQGAMSGVIAGLNYVMRQKMHAPRRSAIANMSLGFTTPEQTLSDVAVKAAIRAGIIVCVAAGNEGDDAANASPAHVHEAITVGAYDEQNQFASFSNWGPMVDVLAPGVGIESISNKGGYKKLNGTSMATPHVTGIVALILSAQGPGSAERRRLLNEWTAAKDERVVRVPEQTTSVSVYATAHQLGA